MSKSIDIIDRDIIEDLKEIARVGKRDGKSVADFRKAVGNYIKEIELVIAEEDIAKVAMEVWRNPDDEDISFSTVDKTSDLLGATKAVGIGAVQGIPFIGEFIDEAVAAAQAAAEALKQGDLDGFQENYNDYYRQLHETGAWKDAKNHPVLSGAMSVITGLLGNPTTIARGITDAALSIAGAIESQFLTGTDRDKENAAKEMKDMANAGLLVAGGAAALKVGSDVTKAFTKMGDQPAKTWKLAFQRGREGHSLATRKDALKYKEKIDKDITDFQNTKIDEMSEVEKSLRSKKDEIISNWDKENEPIKASEITQILREVSQNLRGEIKKLWTPKSKKPYEKAIQEVTDIWFGFLFKDEKAGRKLVKQLVELETIGEPTLAKALARKEEIPESLSFLKKEYNEKVINKSKDITNEEFAEDLIRNRGYEIEDDLKDLFKDFTAKDMDKARAKAWEQSEYANVSNIMFGGQKGTIKKVTPETKAYGDIADKFRNLLDKRIEGYAELNRELNRRIIAKDIVKTNKLSDIVPTARREFESVDIQDFEKPSRKKDPLRKKYVTKFQFLKEYAPEVADEIVEFENDYIDPALRAFQAGADIRAQDLGDLAAYAPSVSFLRSLGSVAPRTGMFLGRQVGRAERATPEAIKEAARKLGQSGVVKFARGEGERQSRISRLQDVAEAIRSENVPDIVGGATEMVLPESEAAMQGALNLRQAVQPEEEIPKYIKRNSEGVESNSDLIQEILKMQEPMLFKEFVNAVNKDDKETAAKIAAEVSANHEEFFEPSPIQTATGARIKSAWSDHKNQNAIKIHNPLEVKQMAHDITEKEDMSETEKMRAVQKLHKHGIIERQQY